MLNILTIEIYCLRNRRQLNLVLRMFLKPDLKLGLSLVISEHIKTKYKHIYYYLRLAYNNKYVNTVNELHTAIAYFTCAYTQIPDINTIHN